MKRYEIIKKTRMNSDGSEYDRFYIVKSFLGIKYTSTKFLYNDGYKNFEQQMRQEPFIIISLFINFTFSLLNFIENNGTLIFDRTLGFSISGILLAITLYLNYKWFPLKFNSLENAKDYISLIIKRKKFKPSTTKVANYNIVLEYFDDNNRLDKINKLKI